jgi:hypothetical protein
MKYELETIPVWDAYRRDSECPLCILEKKNEEQYTKFFLGDSIMDPDTRVEANRLGFCPAHAELLFEGGHKLGVALMTHTYLVDMIVAFRKGKKQSEDFWAKNKKIPPDFIELLKKPQTECIFCSRLSQTIDRYVFTILYLFRKDDDFKKTFLASKGFCLKHLCRSLEMAEEELKGVPQDEFVKAILDIEEKRLSMLEGEIDWFTQKFDYRNQDKPWGNSRDALVRTLQKLKGHRFLDKK